MLKSLLILALLAGALSSFADDAPDPLATARQIAPKLEKFTSGHYILLSDADPSIAQTQLDVLEETYNAFAAETAAKEIKRDLPDHPLPCILFNARSLFQDFIKKMNEPLPDWSSGAYLPRSRVAAFFNDLDNPAFKEAFDALADLDRQLADSRDKLNRLLPNDLANRLALQKNIRELSTRRDDLFARIKSAAALTTIGKSRHEAAHQLFFAAGIQSPDKPFPWFLSEGLACLFETGDKSGAASPGKINQFRLETYQRLHRENDPIDFSQIPFYTPQSTDPEAIIPLRYAQAWMLTHYLWNDQPAVLRAIFSDLAETTDPKSWKKIYENRLDPTALNARVERAFANK
jgi:hypothetical protein